MLDQLVKRAREKKYVPGRTRRRESGSRRRFCTISTFSTGTLTSGLGTLIKRPRVVYRTANLFDPEPDTHRIVVVDETNVAVEDQDGYVWAAVDRHTFEVIHVEVSLGRQISTHLSFFAPRSNAAGANQLLSSTARFWYNWSLDKLDLPYEARRETWGDRSIVESWFTVFKFRTRQFFDRFPYHSSWQSVDRWVNAFAVIHNARC